MLVVRVDKRREDLHDPKIQARQVPGLAGASTDFRVTQDVLAENVRVQSYLFFYDHLSKANWFLEQVLDLVDEKLESRKMQFLFSNMPAQDGGKLLWLFELTAL